MKRKILIGALALGTLAGFGSGFASLHHHCHHRDEMAARLTRTCVDAAMEAAGRDGANEAASASDEPRADHHGWRGRHFARIEGEVRQRCAHEGRRHRH
jgi:hypothetical protein